MHPKALLEHCAELLRQVLTFAHPADATVSRYLREHRALGPRERATVAETTYAAVRRKLLLEALARSGSGPRERRIAILAFHGPQSLLDAALGDAERQWLRACTPVLQHPENMADLLPQHIHNLPQWLADALCCQLQDSASGPDAGSAGAEFDALAAAMLQSAPLDLRVNTQLARREAVQAALKEAGIHAAPTSYSPWGLRVQGKPALARLDVFRSGQVEVQDEGSQLLALLLDARRGEMITDFCAGAGGKTLAIGAAMRSTGRLYAMDVSAHRLDALKPRLARSGLSNVHPIAIAHERDERIKRLSAKMDRVLVDAPCSGLGTLRRNPDLKWRQSPQAVDELVYKQQAILQSAARLVKPGGRLVYATCSLLTRENEEVASAFSVAHPDFIAQDAGALLQALKVRDAAQLCSPGADFGTQYLRLWPHRHQMDGFFAAVWTRRG